MMKRFISVLVVLCCLIGLCPMQVLAVTDLEPPVITGAYLSAPGVELQAGGTVDISVMASDASGIESILVRFELKNEDGSTESNHYLSSYAHIDSASDTTTGTFIASIYVGSTVVDGTYQLVSINARDIYGNETTASTYKPGNIDFTEIWITVSGNAIDVESPEVLAAQLAVEGAVLTAGETFDINVTAADSSGIESILVRFELKNEDGSTEGNHYLSSYAHIDSASDRTSGVFTASVYVGNTVVDGTYQLVSINARDIYGNDITVSTYKPGNIDFSSLCITVAGNTLDREPPEILAAQLAVEGAVLTAGETFDINVTAADSSGIESILVRFELKNEDGSTEGNHYLSSYAHIDSASDRTSGVFTASVYVGNTVVDGTYQLCSIGARDVYGNETWITTYDPKNIDITSIWFIVASTDVQPEKVSIPDSVELPVRSVYTLTPDVTPKEAIPCWTWDSEDPTIATANVARNGLIVQITGLKAGTTTITGTTSNGLSARTVVTVMDAPLPEEGRIEDSYSVDVSGFVDIHPDLLPAGATSFYEVTSDNPHVASIEIASENNTVRIRGNNAGKATVTISGANGVSMTTTIIVGKPTDPQHEKVTVPGYDSTCTRHGMSDAIRCSECYYYFKESVELPLVPHTEEIVPGRESTCMMTGYSDWVRCSVCGATLVEPQELPLGPHKEETIPGWEATCTQTGRTDAVRCSYCYTYLVEPEEIPMKPHTYSEWEIIEEATPYSAGLRGHYCQVCGYYEEEEYSLTPEPTPRPSQPSTTRPDPTTEPTPESTATPSPSTTTAPTTQPTPAPTAIVEPTPEPTKPQVNVGDQNIEVTVDENTAAVTVPEQDLEEAIDAAAEKGVLEVDVSNLEDVSQFTLSQNVVNAVTKSEDVTGLKLKTANGDITLDGNALQTVADTITSENDEVKLTVKTIDPKDIPDSKKYPIAPVLNRAVFIELSADVIHKDASGKVTGTDAIHEFNGEVTVSVPYELPENMKGRQVIACYIADDGSITYFNVVYKDGIATFTTRHFSTFAIVESYAAVFEDIDISKWYMTSIEYALAHELMAGESDTIFAPDGMVSRAMAVQLLYNLSGQPETDVSATFADVDAGKWYAPAIAWAENEKVAAGYGNNQFGPDDSVTREQLATMLWQYAGRPETAGSIDSYEDAADVSSWAKKALCWAVENGIMQGSANHLNPKATASRAEAAALMANLHQVLQSGKSA